MEDSSGWKLFQKRIYDILSHRHGTVILICGCILVIVSAFQFGEAFLEWSEEKYATVFNSFSDNLAGRSYRKRLCLPVPIDVVYTWVNGSDPNLIYELRKHKMLMEIELNQTKKKPHGECTFSNCIPTSSMIVDPALPQSLGKDTLSIIYPSLKTATDIYHIKDPQYINHTVTVIEFETQELTQIALNKTIILGGKNASLLQAYYTTDWTIPNTVLLPTLVVLSGFPHTFSEENLKNHLPKATLQFVKTVEIHSAKGIAVVTMTNKEECAKFIEEGNVTIEGKQQQLNAAYLVWNLRDYTLGDDIAANRFEDNEEMRYSMRSIEQYAPWVRQIFLITNGQIPYWLNLDNPRLTLVTHSELFTNKSHLPSFSSCSIETHIHKIPGLSEKFIYMNDDVMFGKEVWPDDFFTHSKGQKVYLTWPVPNCQDGCPSTWIKDGYCDKACNNTECEYDGGDCTGANANNQGVGWGGGWNDDNKELYCNSGCANNWLSDRYCDQSCNVHQCGFDVGDCGTDSYKQLYEIKANQNTTHYELPKGIFAAFINISRLFGPEAHVTDGEYDESKIIRSMSIAQKFHVVSLLLMKDFNMTKINVTLKWKAKKDEEKVQLFNFTLTMDTNTIKLIEGPKVENKSDGKAQNETKKPVEVEERFEFDTVPVELQHPKAKRSSSQAVAGGLSPVQQVNMTQYMLPDDIDQRLSVLVKQHKEGLLTLKGFRMREAILYDEFTKRMKSEGKPLVKRPPKPVEDNEKLQLNVQDNLANVEHYNKEVIQQNNLQVKAVEQDGLKAVENINQNDLKVVNDNENIVVNENAGNVDGDGNLNVNNIVGGNEGIVQNQGNQQQDVLNNNVQNQQENVVNAQNKDQINDEQPLNNEQVNQNGKQNQQQFPGDNANNIGNQNIAADVLNNNVQNQQENVVNAQNIDQIMNQEPLNALENEQVNAQNVNHMEQQQQNQQQLPGDNADNVANQNNAAGVQDVDNNNAAGAQNVIGDKNAGAQDVIGGNNAGAQNVVGDGIAGAQNVIADEESHKGRKLNGLRDGGEGLLPWEKSDMFKDIEKELDARDKAEAYNTEYKRRKLLDHFSDSLRFVNKLYNNEYGYSARKVPAHMPHLIDRNIMYELHAKYPTLFDATSSHRVRHSEDMQFSFSYFYYVMSEPNRFHAGDVFDAMDTDNSGVMSDREIRTLATRLYDLPLDLPTLTGLETMMKECSAELPEDPLLASLQHETYYDNKMPQVTKQVFSQCPKLEEIIKKKFHAGSKYRYELANEDEITFKMIRSNVSGVVGQLDDIRRKPTKFICLNDNINHNTEEAKTVKAVLQDFYESIFPIPSTFELPREYRNRFLHIDELREWRKYRDWLKLWTQIALFLLIMFTIGSFFSDKLEALKRKVFGRRQVLDSANKTAHRPLQSV